MPDTPGSLMGRAAAAACLTLVVAARTFAQSPAPIPPGPEFLNRYDFHLSANRLVLDDPSQRFSWDTRYGGDLDLFDYVLGRTSILIDYEAVLGDQFRPFDPNQAYYVLEVSSSYRRSGFEFAGVFHHVSRHLSDRPKRFAIAWNVLGMRVMRRLELGGTTIDARADGGAVVQHSFVDYTWTGDIDLLIRRAVTPRVGVFAHGYGEMFGVDASALGRSSQTGGRVEAGVRFNGRAGALELFAGFERRLDADPLDLLPQRWGIAGFRLVSR